MALRLLHVALNTANLDRMVEFYGRAFGLAPIGTEYRWANYPDLDRAIGVEGSAARVVLLQADQICIELFEYLAPEPQPSSPLRPHDRGYTHIAFEVSDLAAEMARLGALGMTFGENRPVDTNGVRAIYGYDPEGNV